MTNDESGYIAFDNAGWATLVCGQYAHSYADGQDLACEVWEILRGANPEKEWEGNDEELREAMRSEELSGYDKVLCLADIRSILTEPTRIEIYSDTEVAVDGKVIAGYTLAMFWRTIRATAGRRN